MVIEYLITTVVYKKKKLIFASIHGKTKNVEMG